MLFWTFIQVHNNKKKIKNDIEDHTVVDFPLQPALIWTDYSLLAWVPIKRYFL